MAPFQSLPDEILLRILDLATVPTIIRTPNHASTFKGDLVVKSITERPSAPKRSRKEMKSLALVCRQFWRLIVHFQFEELEVAIGPNTSIFSLFYSKPSHRSVKNQISGKSRGIEELYCMLRDYPHLRKTCRSLSISINGLMQINDGLMLSGIMDWLPNVRSLIIEINWGTRLNMRQPTLNLIRKTRECFPGLESLVLYCGTTNTAIISMCDVVRSVKFPVLKELELWRLGPEIVSAPDALLLLGEPMHDVIAQQGHQASFTRLWLMSCSDNPDALREFRKWPKELEFVCREVF